MTGHIASDSLGINPFIHELERRGLSVTKIGVVEGQRTTGLAGLKLKFYKIVKLRGSHGRKREYITTDGSERSAMVL